MGTGVQICLWEVHLKCIDKQACICKRGIRKGRVENMPVVRTQKGSPLLFKLKQKT